MLTPTQLTTLRNHIAANTNLIGGVPIQTLPNGGDENDAIAAWYNQTAQAGDAQPFADSRNLWKPGVTITELNSAINWSQNPAGATAAEMTNAWLRWQSMCWSNVLDLTDPQVRSGIAAVWATGGSNAAIKAVGVGRRPGTRFELVFASANRGPNGNAADPDTALNGRVSPFFGQAVTLDDIQAARNS